MTAEGLIREACRIARLPSMAEDQLPESLPEKTKKLIISSQISIDELAEILKNVVGIIDHGSTETIDTLIRRAVKHPGLTG